jgi:hypothetical protein
MNISDQENLPPKQTDHTLTDTSAACYRNPISDITFYDSSNITTRLIPDNTDKFPYTFIRENTIRRIEARQILDIHLKDGGSLPVKPFHDDWIILVLVSVLFIYGVIRMVSKKAIPELGRFFFFRNIGDPVSRDAGELFHWESVLINLVSFINIALFAYCGTVYYEVMPPEFSGISIWLILLVIIITAVTFRHIICSVTGNLSDQKAAFDEYLVTIYQSYRYLAILMFILIVLISYTDLFSAKSLILTGIILFTFVYLIRIIRLSLIFINRNISILYLILYLCALEFLPVVISVKYFTGLF